MTPEKPVFVKHKVLEVAAKLHWKYWLVIVLSWVVTVVAWHIAKENVTQRAEVAFEQEVKRVVSALQERMQKYEDVLWAGVSTVQLLQDDLNVNRWQQFTNSLNIKEKYPGINGLGVIYRIESEQLDQFLQKERRLRPDFTIRPQQPRNDYWPVTYVEPVADNYQAIGLDMSHEAHRYQAAIQARRTGTAQITAPIVLVQDAEQTSGFLFYAPFYGQNENNENPRSEVNFKGLVYAPFIMKALIAGTLQQENRNVSIHISDDGTSVYSEWDSTAVGSRALFTASAQVMVFGRQWFIDFRSLARFNQNAESSLPTFILLGATLLDGLLILILFNMANANQQFSRAYASIRETHMSFLNASGDGYWDWLLQEDYEYMSPRFWEIFGFLPEEKEHKPSAWQDLIVEEDLQIALKNFDLHVATKGQHPYEQEVRYRHKNGSIVTVLCRGRVVEWDGVKPIRMIGTHTDITELKQQARALTVQAEKLEASLSFQRLLMDVNTDFIFVKNEKFEIVQANPAFMSLYPEHMQNKVIGYTTVEEYSQVQADEFLKQDRLAFEHGSSEVIESINFPNGQVLTLLTKKLRFADAAGSQFIIGISRDISHIKRTEEALTAANQELEEFAYRTSHDLRSPLISSRKLLSIIQEELQQGEIDTAIRYSGIVGDSLNKLQQLVTDILNLATVNHGEVTPEQIDLAEAVDDSLNRFSSMENFERVKFEFDFQHQHNVWLPKTYFVLILENLLSNTIKYQDPNQSSSVVKLTTYSEPNSFVLCIEDNGLGIPVASQSKLFSMFKRFHPKTAYGSGLGLYMVNKTVIKLGGEITYHALEKGSKFRVKLPSNAN